MTLGHRLVNLYYHYAIAKPYANTETVNLHAGGLTRKQQACNGLFSAVIQVKTRIE